MIESAAPAADKKKALETCLAQLDKTYGKGTVDVLRIRKGFNILITVFLQNVLHGLGLAHYFIQSARAHAHRKWGHIGPTIVLHCSK